MASFKCKDCGSVQQFYKPGLALFHRWVECPLCRNQRVTRLAKVDHIDRRSRNVFRKALWLLGAPLYHCAFCRYQFRDPRALNPAVRKSPVSTQTSPGKA